MIIESFQMVTFYICSNQRISKYQPCLTYFPYEQSTTAKERQRCYYRLNNEKKLSRRGFYVDLSEEKYINEYGNLILNLIQSSYRGGGVSEVLSTKRKYHLQTKYKLFYILQLSYLSTLKIR